MYQNRLQHAWQILYFFILISDKSDPDRFKGEGISFNAKLIGVEEVPEARGDKMCQEKIQKLKAEIKTLGVHKQKIIINVSEEGIKLIDVRHGVSRGIWQM